MSLVSLLSFRRARAVLTLTTAVACVSAGVAATVPASAAPGAAPGAARSADCHPAALGLAGKGLTRSTASCEPGTARAGTTSATAESSPYLDCPAKLLCRWFGAPYQQNDPADPTNYGNHDLANRPNAGSPNIRYIVIHDSEATFATDKQLIKDPTYISWQYTINSRNGKVLQHVPTKDVAWQAGNWYVNMHSIGIEHTGFAARGQHYYTEKMYRTSAKLVKRLARQYHIPIDRAHIIGHDQVPGTTPSTVAGMHWDPGPFFDWEHYFSLLGHPIGGTHAAAKAKRAAKRSSFRDGQVVTVVPGFAHNRQPVTGCDAQGSGHACRRQPTDFVYLHQQPSLSSPLVVDAGIRSTPATTDIADVGARATAGAKLAVAATHGHWVGVWWLGQLAWIRNAPRHPVLVHSHGVTVSPAVASTPTYGRAYPEATAYPSTIPASDVQAVTPLQYVLQPGQRYVLADGGIQTDYYHATSFADGPGQRVDVVGATRYYQVWAGHRQLFVPAADVQLARR
ncbi:N-acetylmuramoyl-L-alanine amidase [Nocardioides mangrovicus]|uniref:N-acetylmuramoyl-L-alanine amidase n=1 Tax=Nocardioides mangrovicus TaxID=2478913 RepID=A0A3L8NZZ6_9ACTN|nr:peptidoglycan recognition family protein [Nocardioides mangrovicus]RLV48755.1 N-acetylmuramoyl-L-alanine amidase [Nocardioides mangrovicus]